MARLVDRTRLHIEPSIPCGSAGGRVPVAIPSERLLMAQSISVVKMKTSNDARVQCC
jgi:hypothetical protein